MTTALESLSAMVIGLEAEGTSVAIIGQLQQEVIVALRSLGIRSFFNGALLRKSANQAIPNNTFTFVSWDTEIFDTNNYHSNTVNNSRLTVPHDGTYLILANIATSTNTIENVSIHINGNLTSINLFDNFSAVASQISGIINLTASQFVEVGFKQFSGGAINILNLISTNFAIVFLGP